MLLIKIIIVMIIKLHCFICFKYTIKIKMPQKKKENN